MNPTDKLALLAMSNDWDNYLIHLEITCAGTHGFHATATQRAEAFGKVKGLWK